MNLKNPLPDYGRSQSAGDARQELQHLNKSFNHSVSDARLREALLLKQVESIRAKQQSWFGRLALLPEERALVDLHLNRQREAVDTVLKSKNHRLRSIGEANVRFVQEVCNSLLLAGRSGMQTAVRAIYRENALQLNRRLEELNLQFWDLVEQKLRDVEGRDERLQSLIIKQVDAMLIHWNQQYEQILEDFNQLLQEKV